MVPTVAAHLLALGVWVGGLGALVVLGGPCWRLVPSDRRHALLRQLVVHFSRLALVAVGVVILTGTCLAFANLASVADLWRIAYGRVLLAKVVLLAGALLFGARHWRIVPGRLETPGAAAAARSFGWTSAAELAALTAVVGLAAALAGLAPGRTMAGARAVTVRRAGFYTVRLLLAPKLPGPNKVKVAVLDAHGLPAKDVTSIDLELERAGRNPRLLAMGWTGPGQFAGDTNLSSPGLYRLFMRSTGGTSPAPFSVAFTVRLQDRAELGAG
jgi:uncharacterized membrane protein